MQNKRGFFTIAFGKHYHKIAYNLLLSARYNKLKYPFAIISDYSDKYTKCFDVEIIKKPYVKGFLNKLYLDKYAPFEQSLFIDADSLIFNDISFLFDLLTETNENYIAFGDNCTDFSINSKLYFDPNKTKDLHISYIPSFNGGIYFINKLNNSKKAFADARRLFVQKNDYGYRFPNGDESYIALGMSINNIKCYEKCLPIFSGVYYQNLTKVDLVRHLLISTCNDKRIAFQVLHVSTLQTYGTNYKELVGLLKYNKSPIKLLYILKIYRLWSYFLKLIQIIINKIKIHFKNKNR